MFQGLCRCCDYANNIHRVEECEKYLKVLVNDAMANRILSENKKEDNNDGTEKPGTSREENINLKLYHIFIKINKLINISH